MTARIFSITVDYREIIFVFLTYCLFLVPIAIPIEKFKTLIRHINVPKDGCYEIFAVATFIRQKSPRMLKILSKYWDNPALDVLLCLGANNLSENVTNKFRKISDKNLIKFGKYYEDGRERLPAILLNSFSAIEPPAMPVRIKSFSFK